MQSERFSNLFFRTKKDWLIFRELSAESGSSSAVFRFVHFVLATFQGEPRSRGMEVNKPTGNIKMSDGFVLINNVTFITN